MFRWIAAQYCRVFHGPNAMMHPVAGRYRCRECLREWPVEFEAGMERPQLPPMKAQGMTALDRHARETAELERMVNL